MASGLDSLPKFDFELLYNFTHNPDTPQQYIIRPYSDQTVLALTFGGCVAAVGVGINYYSRQDVYDRVLLWRVPLIALWSTTTLPAFALHTKLFTLAHLIADPVDTLWSLIYKLELAKRTTRWANGNDGTVSSFVFDSESAPAIDDVGVKPDVTARTEVGDSSATTARTRLINEVLYEDMSPLPEYFHDIVASIITAYDEWGYGEQATMAMNYGFNADRWNGIQRTALRKRCAEAAFYIASDRVSRFLPSTISSLVFLVQIFAGFWKTLDTLSDTYDSSNPISSGLNRAPHNIAFGALFFWLPFVVLLTSLIGGSQTSHMIPQVLEKFRDDFGRSHPHAADSSVVHNNNEDDSDVRKNQTNISAQDLRHYEATTFPDISAELYDRWSSGGLPVWQVEKFADFVDDPNNRKPSHRTFAWSALTLSIFIIAIPTICAMSVSWLTPTEGFGCRAVTQLSFFLMWIISALIDWILALWAARTRARISTTVTTTPPYHHITKSGTTNSRYRTIYWITFGKDLFFMTGTIITLTWTALGVFNKCECWCKYASLSGGGKRGGYISFLQDDFIFHLIKYRLGHHFPAIIGGALCAQIVIFLSVWFHFREGYRVLKQRDIESVLQSRNSWWNKTWRRFRKMMSMTERKQQRQISRSRTRVVAFDAEGGHRTTPDAEEYPLMVRVPPG